MSYFETYILGTSFVFFIYSRVSLSDTYKYEA